MAKFLRPIQDISSTSYIVIVGIGGETQMFAVIDEVIKSDLDYVRSDTSGCATKEVLLSSVNTPPTGDVVFRYRIKQPWVTETEGTAIATAKPSSTISLYCGTTLIASWSHPNTNNISSFTTFERILTQAQRDAITDWSNVRMKFLLNTDTAEQTNRDDTAVAVSYAYLSWAELEVPSLSGVGLEMGCNF